MSGLVSELLEALAAGTVVSLSELSPNQIVALTGEFGREPFSEEQFSVMSGLVLVALGREEEIAAFNAASPLNKIHPALLADGTPVLPVSLLTWAGKGQGFFGAWELFLSMPVRRITAADWPIATDE